MRWWAEHRRCRIAFGPFLAVPVLLSRRVYGGRLAIQVFCMQNATRLTEQQARSRGSLKPPQEVGMSEDPSGDIRPSAADGMEGMLPSARRTLHGEVVGQSG